MKRVWTLSTALTLLAGTLLCGCGGGSSSAPPSPDFSVTVRQVTPVPTLNDVGAIKATESTTTPATFTVTVTPLHGFTGTVDLASTVAKASKAFGTSFSRGTLSITGTAPQTTQLTVSLNSYAPLGNYSFNVTAQSGSLLHTATVQPTVSVTSPDQPTFVVSTQPSGPTPVEYETSKPLGNYPNWGQFKVIVSPVNGFKGSVTLSATNDQGKPQLGSSFNPPTVTLDGITPQAVTMTTSLLQTPFPAGDYTYTVSGTSGSSTASALVHPKMTVVDGDPPFYFTVKVSPTTVQNIVAGSNAWATFQVLYTSVNGWTGSIDGGVGWSGQGIAANLSSGGSIYLLPGQQIPVTLTVGPDGPMSQQLAGLGKHVISIGGYDSSVSVSVNMLPAP